MIRGTFANIRLRNELLSGIEGGYTRDFTTANGEQSFIYDASNNYQSQGTALVILAGKEFGSGSSRDWAAKGTALLGVKAVIAESFERIHRSNLIGMGVLPLQYLPGQSASSLGLDGTESFSISGVTELNSGSTPKTLKVIAKPTSHSSSEKQELVFEVALRIDTPGEAEYYRHGGILQYVLRSLVA
jgi:aconitate hydratase